MSPAGPAGADEPATQRSRRATRQRAAISGALGASDRFRTAQELHEDLRRSGETVGLTTVYRELQSLADAGEIDALANTSGETIYRRCSSEHHHHHLVCKSCGRSEEVQSNEVEEWARRAAAAHGFSSVDHVVELYGLCDSCAVVAGGP